jgi:hypothetical protein
LFRERDVLLSPQQTWIEFRIRPDVTVVAVRLDLIFY